MRPMFLSTARTPWRALAVFGASILLVPGAMTSSAQAPPDPHAQHATAAAAGQTNQQLMNQMAELRAQVATLQAAVQQAGRGKKSNANSAMPMGAAGSGTGAMGRGAPSRNTAMPPGGMGMMGMMGDQREMGAMSPGGKAAMPPGGGGMGMMGMMDDKGEMGATSPGGKAGMPPGGGGMGMMDDKDEMGGMSAGGNARMSSAPAAAMGMCCMGEMGGMAGGASGGMSGMGNGAARPAGGMGAMNAPSSAMPGQPGASHLYHIGSSGFFLNHARHITLSADQKFTLNRLKERAMLDRASEQRKIDQAEQELYALTGADQLDNSKVQGKITEIEKLRAEERMNFIRAVGEASNVLTHDQHQALMGTMPASQK